MGSSSKLTEGLDFFIGEKFERDVRQCFGIQVLHNSRSPKGSFFCWLLFTTISSGSRRMAFRWLCNLVLVVGHRVSMFSSATIIFVSRSHSTQLVSLCTPSGGPLVLPLTFIFTSGAMVSLTRSVRNGSRKKRKLQNGPKCFPNARNVLLNPSPCSQKTSFSRKASATRLRNFCCCLLKLI